MAIKTIIISLCLSVCMSSTFAQNDADPAITSFSFANAQINVDQSTTLTVFFTNGGFTTPIPAGTVGLNISLPTSFEYGASPESVAALSGTFLSKFNWTYSVANKNFFGVSNQPIAPGDGGTVVIVIKGNAPVTARNSVANIQRLNPGSYPNEDPTNNNLTASLSVVIGGPVPIKLLSFTATKQTKTVLLNWETATEMNSSHFDVQTSRNGTDWTSIGIVQAAGNSNTTQRYSLVHHAPIKGVNYYRLKQVDLDAKFEYSLTRTISFSAPNTITVMPNPTTDKVFITSNDNATLQSVSVYTQEGRLMEQQRNFKFGNSINMSSYAPGVYIMKLIDKDGQAEIVRVVKN